MNSFSRSVFLFSLVLILVSACKKKEIPGPKGDPGTNGTGGSSSTSSSAVFPITNSQWVLESSSYTFTHNSSLITKQVVDKGAVKLFVEINGAWWELPLAEGDLFTQCGFSEGKVKLVYADIHGAPPPTAPVTRNYRLVTLFESSKASIESSSVVDGNIISISGQ